MEVRICARGTLGEDQRRELVGFRESLDGTLLVLRGAVVDQPALLGVLERLRRSGLALRDVERVPEARAAVHLSGGPVVPGRPGPLLAPTRTIARLALQGRVGEALTLALDDANPLEDRATTTVEVTLSDDDDALFDLLSRLERLALDIREVHVRREKGPGGGTPAA